MFLYHYARFLEEQNEIRRPLANHKLNPLYVLILVRYGCSNLIKSFCILNPQGTGRFPLKTIFSKALGIRFKYPLCILFSLIFSASNALCYILASHHLPEISNQLFGFSEQFDWYAVSYFKQPLFKRCCSLS